jgi:hypothetical protein
MSPVKGQPAHSLAVDCLVFGLSGLSNRSDRVPRAIPRPSVSVESSAFPVGLFLFARSQRRPSCDLVAAPIKSFNGGEQSYRLRLILQMRGRTQPGDDAPRLPNLNDVRTVAQLLGIADGFLIGSKFNCGRRRYSIASVKSVIGHRHVLRGRD